MVVRVFLLDKTHLIKENIPSAIFKYLESHPWRLFCQQYSCTVTRTSVNINVTHISYIEFIIQYTHILLPKTKYKWLKAVGAASPFYYRQSNIFLFITSAFSSIVE